MAVDGLVDTLHRQLDPKPDAAYVMDANGMVAFRSLWADDREEVLGKALDAVLRGGLQRVSAWGG